MFGGIFSGRRVLITGHAGFKGAWLSLWLQSLGAKVFGYSKIPDGDYKLYDVLKLPEVIEDSFIGDILDAGALDRYVASCKPEIVFHLAAQPLVRLSYEQPVLTYATNVMGTLNVLEASRKGGSVRAFVNVTTDKCYENVEKSQGYKEDEPMGGYDMYSSSKGCSEILTSSYRRSFLQGGRPFALASARAGNVIGGGDWSADRLLPDCVRTLQRGEDIVIRSPDSTRPWQHVLEPLAGYMLLAQRLMEEGEKFAEGFNFGPEESEEVRVIDVVERVIKIWGRGRVVVKSKGNPHEAAKLSLNIDKAKSRLGFKPVWGVDEAVSKSVEWYRNFYDGKIDMSDFSISQIEDFVSAARAEGVCWSAR